MIDKYKERAGEEARIIKQKEKCKKILYTTEAKGTLSYRQPDQL